MTLNSFIKNEKVGDWGQRETISICRYTHKAEYRSDDINLSFIYFFFTLSLLFPLSLAPLVVDRVACCCCCDSRIDCSTRCDEWYAKEERNPWLSVPIEAKETRRAYRACFHYRIHNCKHTRTARRDDQNGISALLLPLLLLLLLLFLLLVLICIARLVFRYWSQSCVPHPTDPLDWELHECHDPLHVDRKKREKWEEKKEKECHWSKDSQSLTMLHLTHSQDEKKNCSSTTTRGTARIRRKERWQQDDTSNAPWTLVCLLPCERVAEVCWRCQTTHWNLDADCCCCC